MQEKYMSATKARYGSGPSPSLESSTGRIRKATVPSSARIAASPRTERDIATFGRDCLCWSVTYLNSLLGICAAFVIAITDPYIAGSWQIPDGLLFGLVMAVNVVWVGGFVFQAVIGAMRREAGR